MEPGQTFPIKKTRNGYTFVNLGCGVKVHPEWTNLDFSPYTRMRSHMVIAKMLHWIGLLSDQRWKRLNELPEDICSWNMIKGIPFPHDSFDAVYHSHFLEHLNRSDVPRFLLSCHRVLKPNGIIRVVVPDLEYIAQKYINALSKISSGQESAWIQYDESLDELFEQMVRNKSKGMQEQKKWVAKVEHIFRGDPGKIGELHRWMYDKHSLTKLLSEAGFVAIKQHAYNTSEIPDWHLQNLDCRSEGGEYKNFSLYIEGRKPS